MKFETIPCPLCGAEDYQPVFQVRDRFETIPGQLFTIVRCSRCRLLFVNPRPDQDSLSDFYKSEGYDPFVSSRENGSLFASAYKLVRGFSLRRKASRVVEGIAAGSATLDIGCATGEFLVELKRRGYQPFGVEPDPRAAKFACESLGLTVWTGSVPEVPKDQGPFELITLWHVLEHVPNLTETLAQIRHLLSETGRLAIAVPNPLSSDARAYGSHWVAWDAPRHLYDFEPPVMLELLTRAGFRAERRGAVAFDAFYHSLLSESGRAGIVRAAWRGSQSYLRGMLGRDGSSELYFAYQR